MEGSLGYNFTMNNDLMFICGGAWSGKTDRAAKLASECKDVVWIGTAANTVNGLHERIGNLKATRPASWSTIDSPFNLVQAVTDARARNPKSLIVIDSVSQWISNEIAKLSAKFDEWQLTEALMREVDDLCAQLSGENHSFIVVSSDFGSTPPPLEPSQRVLRMCAGKTNQAISALSGKLEFMLAGVVYFSTNKT